MPRRIVVVAIVSGAAVGLGACDKPKSPTVDEAAIVAAVEKARREDAEADRQMRECAVEQEQQRRAAEQAVIDARAEQEDARRAKQASFEAQVRATLVDPSSFQIRNQRLTADGTALCAEVNAKNKRGVYAGFRRVIVTETGISFDLDPDDNYRRPEIRFAAIAKLTGCY